MLRAAIGPRHLTKGGDAEIGTTYVAPAVAVIAGVDQLPAALDLIECCAQDLLGTLAGLSGEQLGELGWPLSGEHIGEQGRENLAATQKLTAKPGHRGGIEAHGVF